MDLFNCDGSYEKDLREYNEEILLKYGVASQTAERETMCLADSGNTVALKLYADMFFYKKILRKNPYRDAFTLYMKSAGISVKENGEWVSEGASYPLSFWVIGYYLVNYDRESFLKKCERIDIIDRLSRAERLSYALNLAISCINHVSAAGAVNLIGRILKEVSGDYGLFNALKTMIEEGVSEKDFPIISLSTGRIETAEECAEAAEDFFLCAAREGYVYACNNLAAREAEHIIEMDRAGKTGDELKASIMKYVSYLKLSADKYEPYAANRLGLFYVTGEIRGASDTLHYREYIDTSLAREYFEKATVYPDANSAWAFYNLIHYFHKSYDNNIELMNEHMEYIRELNPEVYDIAME